MRTTSSISFVCRPSKVAKTGLAPVEMSIIINGARTYLALPRKEKPTDFKKLISSRRPNDLKTYLEEAYSKVIQKQTDMMQQGIPLTASALKDYIQYGCSDSYTVGQLFSDFLAIQKRKVGKTLTAGVYSLQKVRSGKGHLLQTDTHLSEQSSHRHYQRSNPQLRCLP